MEAIKNILPSVIASFLEPEKKIRAKLFNEWGNIAGPEIAKHTRPSLAKNGTLYIWVDQSSLAFEISQRYKASLLKRVQALVGESEAKEIKIKVGQLRN